MEINSYTRRTAASGPVKTQERSSWETRWVLLLLVLAAAVRLYWGLRPRVVWGDEPFYLWLGESLLRGEGFHFFGISAAHFSPLFPLLAAGLGRVAGLLGVTGTQALAAGSTTLYVICGTLLALPIYALARRLAGPKAGLCAGLAAALYPALTAGIPLWGTMTEPLYLLLIAAAWWALLVGQQDRRPWAYGAAGAALALAYLERPEAIVYLIAGPAALLLINLLLPGDVRGDQGRKEAAGSAGLRSAALSAPQSRGAEVKRTLSGAAVALITFGLLITPQLVTLHAETGQWQLIEEAGSTYVSSQGLARGDSKAFDQGTWGLDPASGEVYLFSPSSESQGLVAAILADPVKFLHLMYENLLSLVATTFSINLIPWPLAALAGLGLLAPPWNRRRLRGELLLIASLAGPLGFLPFFIQPRYIAGLLIPALVWIGEGTARLAEGVRGSGNAKTQRHRDTIAQPGSGKSGESAESASTSIVRALSLLPALLLALGLLWAAPQLDAALRGGHSFRPAHRAAAAALVQHGAGAADVVLSRYPAIAFHAGTRWAPTPAATWPEVVAYAQRKGARFLAFDAREATLRPQLAFLLDPATTPGELDYLTTVDDGTGPVALYRFR